MTTEELKYIIEKKIAGQGSMIDVGGVLPVILNALVGAVAGAPDEGIIAALKDGTLVPKLAETLASWDARGDAPVNSVSYDLIRTTGGDVSIDSAGGALLMAMVCVGDDFTPTRIISSGYNLLRLQSNNGPALALGGNAWCFPVPRLVCTEDSINTANENNGMLFTARDGSNLTPTVTFKPLWAGVPSSSADGNTCAYVDINERRHYITSGPGWLIVTGIDWANTCAHIAWSTDYDKFVAPDDPDDAGTIVDTSAVGTLRSVGSGSQMVSDRADRTSPTTMRKTVNVGVSSALTWTDVAEEDSDGNPTGSYTHSTTISDMRYGGVASIKVSGASAYADLAVDGQLVSFTDTNATVASGYVVKYQLDAPVESLILVATELEHISDWGVEYVEATGDGQGLWQYKQGIPDALYGLLSLRTQDNQVIAEAIAALWYDLKALREQMATYNATIKASTIDTPRYMVLNRPVTLESSTAGAPSVGNVPTNWDEKLYGHWKGGATSFEQQYIDKASGKWYKPKSVTNTPADWVALN